MNELALFAGAGGGILGGKLLGWRTVCAVEIESYPREILLRRQEEGHLEPFPIWDDVATFDGKPWRGKVDVISGGFPCQDISCAGKGKGITGKRSGLWGEMARIIGEVRPQCVFVENSPLLVSRGFTTVLGDLAEMGYDVEWCIVSASDCGAPHKRDRLWIMADSYKNSGMGKAPRKENNMVRCSPICERYKKKYGSGSVSKTSWPPRFEQVGSIPNMVDGMANRVEQIAAIGNGQVPIVAATAWKILTGEE